MDTEEREAFLGRMRQYLADRAENDRVAAEAEKQEGLRVITARKADFWLDDLARAALVCARTVVETARLDDIEARFAALEGGMRAAGLLEGADERQG